jgi:hypothetical protein
MLDPEELLPKAIQWAVPSLKEQDEGEALVREATGNQALSYEERSELLRQGQQLQNDTKDLRRRVALGEGLVAGGLGALLLNKALNASGGFTDELTRLRQISKMNALEEATRRAEGMVPGFRDAVWKNVSRTTGLSPRQYRHVKDAIQGPLRSLTGNLDDAIQAAGGVFAEQARTKNIPILGPSSDKAIYKAFRLTTPGISPVFSERALQKIIGFGNKSRELSGSTLARFLMAGAGVGLGGLVGYLSSKSLPDEVVMTPEEAEAYLRDKDRSRARGNPVARLPQALQPVRRGVEGFNEYVSNKYVNAPSLLDGIESAEDDVVLPSLQADVLSHLI